MNKNTLIGYVRTAILAGLSDRSLDYDVVQSGQSTTQGTSDDLTIYIGHIVDERVGQATKHDVYDDDTSTMTETLSQRYDTTLQIMARGTVDPGSTMTEHDLIRTVHLICSSDAAAETWAAVNIYPQAVQTIRNVQSINDRGKWSDNPSFDLILGHVDSYDTTINIVTEVSASIDRI